MGNFGTLLALLGYLWGLNKVQKHFEYLLIYINNFPLDIIALGMQNQTRISGRVVGGGWLDQLRL